MGDSPLGQTGGWTAEDFFDPYLPADNVDDPWSFEDDVGLQEGVLRQTEPVADDEYGDDWRVMELDSDGLEYTPVSEEAGYRSDDEEGHEETWDEPEPVAEYSGELREPLHEVDGQAVDIHSELPVDEFVAGIQGSTKRQRSEIATILLVFSRKKRANWLFWLKKKEWTGHSLLLFLQFWEIWLQSPDWWESFGYSYKHSRWWAIRSSSVLSRDDSYALIKGRLHCKPNEVIRDSWFEDWDNLMLWRYGFNSFASFVMFRAGLDDGEDWRAFLSLEEDSESLIYWANWKNGKTRVSRPRQGPPSWWVCQDWYDPSEWHDNLGWANEWLDASDSILSDRSLGYSSSPPLG